MIQQFKIYNFPGFLKDVVLQQFTLPKTYGAHKKQMKKEWSKLKEQRPDILMSQAPETLDPKFPIIQLSSIFHFSSYESHIFTL